MKSKRSYKEYRKLNLCVRCFCFSVLYQKRFKKEKETRKRLQDQLDQELKRRSQLEEAIKTTTSNSEILRLLNGKIQNIEQYLIRDFFIVSHTFVRLLFSNCIIFNF